MTSARACLAAIVFALVANAPALRAQDTATTRRAAAGPITLPEAIRIALAQNSLVRFARR